MIRSGFDCLFGEALMHELTDHELYQALSYAKSLDEDAGRTIIVQCYLEQTALAETLFELFPSVIAEENEAMAHCFMDLCFDVLCVYQNAFGPLPLQHVQRTKSLTIQK